MTPEIRNKLDSLHKTHVSQGQTGEFVRRMIPLLQSCSDVMSADEINDAIRQEARKVCDDDEHVEHCLLGKLT